jgi:hypothetical protein
MPKKSTAAINLHGVAKRAANVRLDPLFGAGQTRFGSAAAVDRYNRLAERQLYLWPPRGHQSATQYDRRFRSTLDGATPHFN